MGNYAIGLRERYNVTKNLLPSMDAIYYQSYGVRSPIQFPWYCAFFDLGALVVFVLSAFGFNKRNDEMAAKADRSQISVEDYSIAVEGLPPQLKDAAPVRVLATP